MIPIHNYKLIYDDGDKQDVSIRLAPTDAKHFYFEVTFGFWCAMENTEKSHSVYSVEYIIPDMSKYPQIGLSADWVYRTWLIEGDKGDGVVVFENEENDTYILVEFHRDEDGYDTFNDLYTSDSIEMCLSYYKEWSKE
jgi:hypothetical protein